MNLLLPATAAAALSFAATFIAPPLIAIISPVQLSSDVLRCEGYYPNTDICLSLGSSQPAWYRRTRSNADCPQWRIASTWTGKDAFTEKLSEIEKLAKEWENVLVELTPKDIEECGDEIKPPVWIRRERGVAWSRMEEGIIAGNSEFHSDRPEEDGGHICWTDALLPMYVEKFNVKPSDEFTAFVLSFDIEKFRDGLDKLRQCAPLKKME